MKTNPKSKFQNRKSKLVLAKEKMTKATTLHKELEKICRRYHVEIMYAFGSRCHELKNYVFGQGCIEEKSASDVDVGVKVSRSSRLSVRDKVTLAIELEDLFDIGIVDLIILGEADPFVAANVVRGERLYAEDTYVADEYELYVLRRAGDLAYLERKRLHLILGESA